MYFGGSGSEIGKDERLERTRNITKATMDCLQDRVVFLYFDKANSQKALQLVEKATDL